MQVTRTSCPEALRKQQKLFSNKLHQHVLKSIEDVKNSFDKVSIKTIDDEKYLLYEINIYFHDLCDIVFQLQQIIIKIDSDLSVSQELREVSDQIRDLSESAYQALNLKPEELISKIKEDVDKISAPVEALIKIVEHEDVEGFWQKVLYIEHDLLSGVEKLMLYNQLRYLNFSELEDAIHTEFDNIKNVLIRIANDHDILEEDLNHYTSHSIQQIQKILNGMRKSSEIEIKDPELSKLVLIIQGYGYNYVNAVLDAVKGDQPLDKFIQSIDNCHENLKEACKYVDKLVTLVNSENIDEATSDLINHLLVASFVTGLSSLKLLDRSLDDAILYK